jgi:hypothetical protein
VPAGLLKTNLDIAPPGNVARHHAVQPDRKTAHGSECEQDLLAVIDVAVRVRQQPVFDHFLFFKGAIQSRARVGTPIGAQLSNNVFESGKPAALGYENPAAGNVRFLGSHGSTIYPFRALPSVRSPFPSTPFITVSPLRTRREAGDDRQPLPKLVVLTAPLTYANIRGARYYAGGTKPQRRWADAEITRR